jgi:two-component system, OmpR family, sensor histidine kinase KdpD
METPEEILEIINKTELKKIQGKLKIFFGMCAGVGKTYSMLQHGKDLLNSGKNIIIGYVETHGREETAKLVKGFSIIPRLKVNYKGINLEEFNLEKVLQLKPEYVIVDELAHSNIQGLKHSKRYQDVLELLDNGISVLTTLNVQHIESRSKTVEKITGIPIHETVPDSVIEIAENIELIDLPIEELLQRLSEGKVYVPDKAKVAFLNFFKTGNLISLREMALRLTAEKVESDLMYYKREKNIEQAWKANDKLMVAVGPSPFSAELISWTRRMAYTLKTTWYAVYVKTNIKLNDNEIEQLEKNLRLAKELGAEVITSADTDLVDGLLQIAKRHNISQIIIGKPAKYGIMNYIKKDNYIDRLIQQSGDIHVYIVRPSQLINNQVKKQRAINFTTSSREYFLSALSVILLSSICYPLMEYLGYQSVGLILLLNLLLMPFYAGRGAILISAVLNSIIWNFFFIPPLFTFEIGKLHDVLTLLLNLVIALTSGLLVTRIRKQKALVQIREKHTIALLNYTKELSKCLSKNEAISVALKHIDLNFNANSTFFDENAVPKLSSGEFLHFEDKEIAIVKWALDNNRISGKYTNNLPNSKGQFFPIVSKKSKIGVIYLLLSRKLSIEKENLINNMIEQLILVYEKEEAEEKVKKLIVEAESKKLYDTLLDSISHEFRTPIAVISGSSTSLLENNIIDKPELVRNFAGEIYLASKRLNILVENLLDITRLESGNLKLNKDLYNINEVITETLLQLKGINESHKIIFKLNATNPLILIDYGFISQAIFNILHNAFLYTHEGTNVIISSESNENDIIISIADTGMGLSDESMDRLFDKFYRPPGTKAGGTGLGLSIAKGFIEAHNGTLNVRKNEPNGLIFDIILHYD